MDPATQTRRHLNVYPSGVNLAANTSMMALAALAAPLTLLAGPGVTVTVCFVVAMPISAASAYWVLRRGSVWAPASALGGLAYGFSPYMIDQGASHLNLVLVPLPPLIIAAIIELINRPRSPWRWGLLLGGLVSVQFLVSSEILAMTAIAVGIGALLVAGFHVRHHREMAEVVRSAARGCTVAVGSAAFLLAYPLWYQFAGPGHYSGPPKGVNNSYYSNLLDFVAPTSQQAVRPLLGGVGAQVAAPAGAEAGAYIGIGFLIILVLLVRRVRRCGQVRLMAALAGIFAVLSLGRHMVIYDRQVNLPLPFDVLAHLPLVDSILPIRFSFITDACIAAILALAINELHRQEHRRAEERGSAARSPRLLRPRSVLALVGTAMVVTWLPAWPYSSQSVPRLPAAIVRAIPGGDPAVLTYPYPTVLNDEAMSWQSDADFRIRLLGGYAFRPDSHGRATLSPRLFDPPAVTRYLIRESLEDPAAFPPPPSNETLAAQIRAFVGRQQISSVIVDVGAAHGAAVAQEFALALGPPQVRSADVVMWIEAPTGNVRPQESFSVTP